MDTSTTRLIGPLYHGTRDTAARIILREGFRRSRSRNYTGTGICLSESLTLAYEYGMYETGGCVLEARLAPSARWTDRLDGRNTQGDVWDTQWDMFMCLLGVSTALALFSTVHDGQLARLPAISGGK